MKHQKFEIAYHLNTWDMAKLPLEPAFAFLQKTGFRAFEALVADTLMYDFSRRHLTLPLPRPPMIRDIDMLERLGIFSRAQTEYGLRLSALYMTLSFTNPNLRELELDNVRTIARYLKGSGAEFLVVGGGRPEAGKPHAKEDYDEFSAALTELGRVTRELGIRTAYHPHLDCFIETREHLDAVMEQVDTKVVGLCIDPAHLQIKGSDPVDALRAYIDHIDYMHFKDVQGDVENMEGHARYRSFCELGAGRVDFRGMTDVLLEADYSGYVVIELDATRKTAEESCMESVAFVRDVLGLELVPGKTDL